MRWILLMAAVALAAGCKDEEVDVDSNDTDPGETSWIVGTWGLCEGNDPDDLATSCGTVGTTTAYLADGTSYELDGNVVCHDMSWEMAEASLTTTACDPLDRDTKFVLGTARIEQNGEVYAVLEDGADPPVSRILVYQGEAPADRSACESADDYIPSVCDPPFAPAETPDVPDNVAGLYVACGDQDADDDEDIKESCATTLPFFRYFDANANTGASVVLGQCTTQDAVFDFSSGTAGTMAYQTTTTWSETIDRFGVEARTVDGSKILLLTKPDDDFNELYVESSEPNPCP